MSVKEVALTLGFSNQNYFSACFKKRTGVPLSMWKND
ncbi:MAG: AraC family transcriptional regulator [Clostridia bacterium]|nr:AraC family transcriptional regulator [Clostridia bacterium]